MQQPEPNTPARRVTGERGTIHQEEFLIPQMNRKRTIRIYLPPGYGNRPERYPVLYLQDGQLAFANDQPDRPTWRADEQADLLFNESGQGYIVVAIDHGEENRINEYAPWHRPDEGGGEGGRYAEFIVHTLKPYIDRTYRTLPGMEHTAIMGSSMGGLISLFAAKEYPHIFGHAAIFSPSLWFFDGLLDWVKNGRIDNSQRFYLVAGKKESDRMVRDLDQLYYAMLQAGYGTDQLFLQVDTHGIHHESFWAKALLPVLRKIMAPARVAATGYTSPVSVSLEYPHLMISADERIDWPSVKLFSADGCLLRASPLFYCANRFLLPGMAQIARIAVFSGQSEIVSFSLDATATSFRQAV